MREYRVAVKTAINRGGILYEERTWGFYYPKEKAVATAKLVSQIYQESEVRVTYKNWNTVKGTPIFKNGKEM